MSNYIYGKNPIKQLLSSQPQRIKKIFITPQEKELVAEIQANRITYVINNREQLTNLVDSDKHQGIVALIADYQYSSLEELFQKVKNKKFPLVLIVDQIEDPRNFGAILRTCDAVNVDAVIILKQRQVLLNATVAKTSAGAINHVMVIKVTNLSVVIETLKQKGFWIFASDAKSQTNYCDVDYRRPTALIVGSEGKGISAKLLKNADYIVKIPMTGKVNSLNAAVASAVLLYEIRKQQNNKGV